MRTRIGWTIASAFVIVASLGAALPAPAQDPRNGRPDTRETRSDKPETTKERKDLEASRQQLRAAYKSGDPAAIKAARENYQKHRSELRGADQKGRDVGASAK